MCSNDDSTHVSVYKYRVEVEVIAHNPPGGLTSTDMRDYVVAALAHYGNCNPNRLGTNVILSVDVTGPPYKPTNSQTN